MARIAAACAGVLVVSIALVAGLGNAQLTRLVGPDQEAILYDGDLQLDSGGIDVVSWGSGRAEPVYEETYVGPQVLKVSSQGPYQGIVLQLGRPATLEELVASGNAYLDVRVLPGQPSLEYRRQQEEMLRQQARAGMGMRGGRGGGGGMRGGGGGMRGGGMRGGGGGGMRGGGGGGMRGGGMRGGGGGGMRGGGMRGGGGGGMRGGGMRGGGGGGMRGGGMRGGGGGGMRGGGMRGGGMRGGGMRGGGMRGGRGGMAGGRGPGAAAAATDARVFTARNLRLVLFTDEGMMEASSAPITEASKDERGWVPVTVSLSDMTGAEGAGEVRAVGIFTDESDVFYLGRVSLLADSKSVEVTITAEPLFARPDQLISFSASLRGGPVNPEISWDFNDQDGIERQALGREVQFLYKEPGDYVATCTVTDKSGIREPATATIGLRVEGSPEPVEYAW